jgi:hypothetical protein
LGKYFFSAHWCNLPQLSARALMGHGVVERCLEAFVEEKKFEPRIASDDPRLDEIGSDVSIGRQPSNQTRLCSALMSFQEKNNF